MQAFSHIVKDIGFEKNAYLTLLSETNFVFMRKKNMHLFSHKNLKKKVFRKNTEKMA
jgi:hypothetical protein